VISDFKETRSGFRYLTLDGIRDLSAIQKKNPEQFPFLLDSSSHGPNSRYSILFGLPGDDLLLPANGELQKNGEAVAGDFLNAFDDDFQRLQMSDVGPDAPLFPFTGGWFVFLSYELVQETEPSLKQRAATRRDRSGLPVARATRVPLAFIVDHRDQTTSVIAEDRLDHKRIELALKALAMPEPVVDHPTVVVRQLHEETPTRYLDAIRRTRRYIRDGDIFQANLSRLWQARVDDHTTPFNIYRRLRTANPAPFSGLVLFGNNKAVISSSPERLVSVTGGTVSTRPIAGTHPRGETTEADRELSQRLLRHPKERAEHIMLVDLERNDLGRICEPGSVEVAELMALETYSHVHHIVSEVTGKLAADKQPVDVIRAVFPGGTITGCPKVRCMEIIDELEQCARGAYTGSMGYINRDGSMELNILIRTLVQNGAQITFRAGGGIVADSEPERELNETRAKAWGMLRALGKERQW
jgi:anthranilate synthase component 1